MKFRIIIERSSDSSEHKFTKPGLLYYYNPGPLSSETYEVPDPGTAIHVGGLSFQGVRYAIDAD